MNGCNYVKLLPIGKFNNHQIIVNNKRVVNQFRRSKANNLMAKCNVDNVILEVRFFLSLSSISLVVKPHSSKVITMVRIHNRINSNVLSK